MSQLFVVVYDTKLFHRHSLRLSIPFKNQSVKFLNKFTFLKTKKISTIIEVMNFCELCVYFLCYSYQYTFNWFDFLQRNYFMTLHQIVSVISEKLLNLKYFSS